MSTTPTTHNLQHHHKQRARQYPPPPQPVFFMSFCKAFYVSMFVIFVFFPIFIFGHHFIPVISALLHGLLASHLLTLVLKVSHLIRLVKGLIFWSRDLDSFYLGNRSLSILGS